jgi:hypothetical protein
MKLANFLFWLAGGGLVTFATYVGLFLLKCGERLDDAEEERLWQHLLHPGTP